MEKLLYDAIARVILQPIQDHYGQTIESPLREAVFAAVYKDGFIDNLVDKLLKKFDIDEIVEKVVNSINLKFTSRQSVDSSKTLERLVMERLSEKIAERRYSEIFGDTPLNTNHETDEKNNNNKR